MTERVFVYGTLRLASGHERARHLASRSRPLGAARWQGILFDAGDYPVALPSSDPADVVRGEVHELDDRGADIVLAGLDDYEGCGGEDPLYVRTLETVTFEDGATVQAWVWTYARLPQGLLRIEHGDWLRHVRGR